VGRDKIMYYEKEIIIDNPKGLHTRAAAIVSFKATRINKKYDVNLFIQKSKGENRIPVASMLALTTLGIRPGDKLIIGCDGKENCRQALEEMEECLTGRIDVETVDMDEIDRVLDKNTLTSERLIESISNGVLVVNEDNRAILFNRAAEKITGITRSEIIGRKVNEVLEGSRLHEVLKTGEESVQEKQRLGNTTIITNRTPIIVENSIIGAVAVFQDISEIERLSNKLESVMEIKERFGNILSYANDGICMVDEKGIITYVNPEFERIWSLRRMEIQGKYIKDVLPNSAIAKVIRTGKKQLGVIARKEEGVKVISNASPIFINDLFKGVVSISKEETHLQKMIKKLSEAEERVKYFKEELDRKQNIHEAFEIIIGKSGALEDVLNIAPNAAKTSSTV